VDALETIVWFDTFSVNQHDTIHKTFDWWSSTFQQAIKQFGHTVMVLSPWNNPTPLRRVWCLWELYCTVITGSKFEFALGPNDEKIFLTQVSEHSLKTMKETINVAQVECLLNQHKEAIFAEMQRHMTLDDINAFVFQNLRLEMLRIFQATITDASEDHDMLFKVAQFEYHNANHQIAFELIQRCLEIRKRELGCNHPETLHAMDTFASICITLKRYELAESLAVECLDRRKVVLGELHKDTLASIDNLAFLAKRRFATLSIMYNIAYASIVQGNYDFAKLLLIPCYETQKAEFGKHHADTLKTKTALAMLYEHQGEFEQTKLLMLELLMLYESLNEKKFLVQAMSRLAQLYLKQENYAFAKPLLVGCLKKQQVRFVDFHEITAKSLQTLSTMNLCAFSRPCIEFIEEVMKEEDLTISSDTAIVSLLNDHDMLFKASQIEIHDANHETAYKLIQRCYEIRARELGCNHHETLLAMDTFASICIVVKQYELAESLSVECLERRQTVLGLHHEETLRSIDTLASLVTHHRKTEAMNVLADSYAKQGKYDLAEPLLQECLTNMKIELGESHPNTLTAMNSLALVLFKNQKLVEARSLFIQCLNGREVHLGELHVDTLETMRNLAEVFRETGKQDEAGTFYMGCHKKRKEVLGESHPDTVQSLKDLAMGYFNHKKYPSAQPLLEALYQIEKTMFGDNDRTVVDTMGCLIVSYCEQNKHDLAEPLVLQSLETMELVFGEDDPQTLKSMENLARIYEKQDKYDLAEVWHLKCYKKRKTVLGENHPDTIDSINSLVTVFYKTAKHDLRKCLEKHKSVFGESHDLTLDAMNQLAMSWRNQGEYDKAESLYLEYYGKLQFSLGSIHWHTLTTLGNLAQVYLFQDKYDLAGLMFVDCAEKMRSVYHPHTSEIVSTTVWVHDKQGLTNVNDSSVELKENVDF
jgi:tetratricopeptide (TPR) repeat protein